MSSRSEYERALSRELSAVGISGQLRRRILDEIGDHLSCDPQAPLGEPQALAREFADLRGHPWRLAVWFALAVAALITVAAVPAQDVYDGALRGILDALACLAAFAVLGRYLGLWRPAGAGGS